MTLDALQVMRDMDRFMRQNEMITLKYAAGEYIAKRESGGLILFKTTSGERLILDKSEPSLNIQASDKSGLHALSKMFIERETKHEGLDRFLQAGFQFVYTALFGSDVLMQTAPVLGTNVHSQGTSAEDCFARIFAYTEQASPERTKSEIAALLKNDQKGFLHLLNGNPSYIAFRHVVL